jgi:nucleoside-diphosphate-sugar epimerase
MGWEPRVSIEEGLARTVEWFLANRHRYKARLFNV